MTDRLKTRKPLGEWDIRFEECLTGPGDDSNEYFSLADFLSWLRPLATAAGITADDEILIDMHGSASGGDYSRAEIDRVELRAFRMHIETDAELAARLDAERVAAEAWDAALGEKKARAEQALRERELAELARLRMKYEGG